MEEQIRQQNGNSQAQNPVSIQPDLILPNNAQDSFPGDKSVQDPQNDNQNQVLNRPNNTDFQNSLKNQINETLQQVLEYSNELKRKCCQNQAQNFQSEQGENYNNFIGAYDKIQIGLDLVRTVEKLLYHTQGLCSAFIFLNIKEQMIKYYQDKWRLDFRGELIAIKPDDSQQKKLDKLLKIAIKNIASQQIKGNYIKSKSSNALTRLVAGFVQLMKAAFQIYKDGRIKQKFLSFLPLMEQNNNYRTLLMIRQFLQSFLLKHQANKVDKFDFPNVFESKLKLLKKRVQDIITLLFIPPFDTKSQSSPYHFCIPWAHFCKIITIFQSLRAQFKPKWDQEELEIRKTIIRGIQTENLRMRVDQFIQKRNLRATQNQDKMNQGIIKHNIRCQSLFEDFLDKNNHKKQVILNFYYSPYGIQELDLSNYILKEMQLNQPQIATVQKLRILFSKYLPYLQRFEIGQNGHQFDYSHFEIFLQIVRFGCLKHFSILNPTTYINHTNRWFNFLPTEHIFKYYSKDLYEKIMISYLKSNRNIQFAQIHNNSGKILELLALNIAEANEKNEQGSKTITLVLGYPLQRYPLDLALVTKYIKDISITNVSFRGQQNIQKFNTFLMSVAPYLESFKLVNCHDFKIHCIFSQLGKCYKVKELRLQRNQLLCPQYIPSFLQMLNGLKLLKWFSIQSFSAQNINFAENFLSRLILFQCQGQQYYEGRNLLSLENAESINLRGCDRVNSINFLLGLGKVKKINLSYLSCFTENFIWIQRFLKDTIAQIQELAILGYGDRNVEFLYKLKNLKSLAIDSLGQKVNLKSFLRHFSSLQKLTIDSWYFQEVQRELNSIFSLSNNLDPSYPKELKNRHIQLYKR